MVTKLIKKIDIYGEEFEFNYNKEERFQTYCGGFLSTVAYIIIIGIFIRMFQQVIDTQNPGLNSGIQFSKQMPKLDLYKNSIFPIFGLEDEKGPIPVEKMSKYIKIKGEIIKGNYESLEKFDIKIEKIQKINYIKCKELDSETKEILFKDSKNMKDYAEIFGVCPLILEKSKFYIEGNVFSPPFVQFSITIVPCTLSDNNFQGCASREKMKNVVVRMSFNDFNFIAEDKENPVKITPNIRTVIPVDITFSKKSDIFLKENEVYDDDNVFTKESLNTYYIDYDKTTNSFFERQKSSGDYPIYCKDEEKDCEPYIYLNFYSGNKKRIYKRNYASFFGMLSEFGGVEEIISFGIAVFYFVFTSRAYNRSLKEMIFGKKYEERREELFKGKGKKIIEKCEDKVVDGLSDGLGLMKNISLLQIFSDIYLKQHDKILIPLIELEKKYKKIFIENNRSKNEFENHEEETDLNFLSSIRLLKESDPQNNLELFLQDFFFENLGLKKKEKFINDFSTSMEKLIIPDFENIDEMFRKKSVEEEDGTQILSQRLRSIKINSNKINFGKKIKD